MNRRDARELALRLLYAVDFTDQAPGTVLNNELTPDNFTSLASEDELYRELPDTTQRTYISALLHGVNTHKDEIDDCISRYAIGWKTERISRITLSCLRLSLCELQYMDSEDVPPSASINEAVTLAKKYDGQEAGAFVNGILGAFMRDRDTESKPE